MLLLELEPLREHEGSDGVNPMPRGGLSYDVMPIYEYRCEQCEEVFEELILRSSDAETVACPRCGTSHPERLLSAASVSNRAGGSSGGAICVPRGGFS